MFEIGQIVVTRNSGVCQIISEEEINFGVGSKKYLILKPFFVNDDKATKIFIPYENIESNLRNLISKEEVYTLIDSISKMEKNWITDPKLRRTKFEEAHKNGNLKDIIQIIKSLYIQNEELKENKKTLSMLDREIFVKLQKDIYQEFAIVLNVNPSEVEKIIITKIIE